MRLRDSAIFIAIVSAVSCTTMATEEVCFGTQVKLRSLDFALREFDAAMGRYPETLDDLVPVAVDPREPKSVFLDPWGHRFSYRRVGEGYELFSVGADGVPYTMDDVYKDMRPSSCVRPGSIGHYFAKFRC